MPTIYKRFTEKEAKYWRQIYKVKRVVNGIVNGVNAGANLCYIVACTFGIYRQEWFRKSS